jgi:hypothetical protein
MKLDEASAGSPSHLSTDELQRQQMNIIALIEHQT